MHLFFLFLAIDCSDRALLTLTHTLSLSLLSCKHTPSRECGIGWRINFLLCYVTKFYQFVFSIAILLLQYSKFAV